MTFQLPWNRNKKTRVAGIELPRFDLKAIQRATAGLPKVELPKIEIPKVEMPKLPDVSAASIGGVVDDARRAIGGGADQFAEKAGQIGHDAGKLGRDLAATGESNLRTLGADLRNLTRDARSLRVTRQKQGPDMLPGILLLAGLGSGMAAMYFFDPEQGRRRRNLLRDQLGKLGRVATQTVSGRAEDLRNRSMGLAHEARSAVTGAASAVTGATDGRGSIVDSTPEAASELEMTDAAARAYSDTSDIYSTSEPESVAAGEFGTDEGAERDSTYSASRNTGEH